MGLNTKQFYPYASGLLYCNYVNPIILQVLVNQSWRIWVNRFHEYTKDHNAAVTNKQIKAMCISKMIYFIYYLVNIKAVVFLAATKQLYEWFSPSVRPSVRPSVCLSVRLSVTPFWLCSHHPIIMKFSGVITSDKSDVHAKGQGQRSKVKVTEVTTQIFVSGL